MNSVIKRITITFSALGMLALGLWPSESSANSYCANISPDATSQEYQYCMTLDYARENQVDCVECLLAASASMRQQDNQPGTATQIIGALAGPLAMVGSTWLGAHYAHKTQAEWASAFRHGHTE